MRLFPVKSRIAAFFFFNFKATLFVCDTNVSVLTAELAAPSCRTVLFGGKKERNGRTERKVEEVCQS